MCTLDTMIKRIPEFKCPVARTHYILGITREFDLRVTKASEEAFANDPPKETKEDDILRPLPDMPPISKAQLHEFRFGNAHKVLGDYVTSTGCDWNKARHVFQTATHSFSATE